MTFEEFEKADEQTLRTQAKECFEFVKGDIDSTWMADRRIAYLLEAQFYMQERDRRENSRVALRDFRLEIAVIGLIGVEILLSVLGIWLTITEAKNEDTLMKSQNAILTNLQQSTAASAKAMTDLEQTTAASARTLESLVSSNQAVNKGVHDQLALFYDPAVSLSYDPPTKRVIFANTGRTSVTITSLNASDGVKYIDTPRMVAAGGWHYFDISPFYDMLSNQLPKGSTKTFPFSLEIKNELGKVFTMNSDLVGTWDKDTLLILVHTAPLQRKQ